MQIGERIKELRSKSNLTIQELASRINITQPHLSRIEKGERNPSLEVLQNICEALGISLKDFFTTDADSITPLPKHLLELVQNASNLNDMQIQKLNDFIKSLYITKKSLS